MTVSDQKQRLRALEPDISFIVQAPAGSGKTSLLTQRYLVLLARVQAPEEIIALTFTRKAAGEMRERILEALALASQPEPEDDYLKQTWQLAVAANQQNQQLGWQLAHNPNRLRIQTIDALCASLTKQMPVLARFGAQPTMLDNPEQVYLQAARNVLNQLNQQPSWQSALEKLLLHLDNNLGHIERLLMALLAKRDQWLPYLLTAKQTTELRERLQAGLQQVNDDVIEQLQLHFSQELFNALMPLARFAADNVRQSHADSPIVSLLDEADALPQKSFWQALSQLLLTKDNNWRKTVDKKTGFPAPSSVTNKDEKALYKHNKERMKALLEQLQDHSELLSALNDLSYAPPEQYSEQQWQMVLALIELLPIACAELQILFQQYGQVDFIEVANQALFALGELDNPSDLALQLDYKIQHLLVDEFQDTSINQFHLLEKLTSGWQTGDGRTLFLVGDPMQSIYRFRQAEVGLFLQAREQGIHHIHLESLVLNSNFRSQQGLIDWFNQAFALMFPKEENKSHGAVCYSPAIAVKPTLDKATQIHTCFDANQTNHIVDIIQQSAADESIAILVRARSHLLELLPALDKASIAYHGVDIISLSDKPVIQDLLSLTCALLHPADRIAWLSVLRAPWCGLTLNELHQLAHDPDINLWQSLQQQSIDNAQLQQVINVLNTSLQQRQRLPLRQWIENTWLALQGPACLTDSNELNDATRFFQLLEQLEQAGTIPDEEQLYTQVARLFASEEPHTDCNVHIMTIHKSKGLEFDTVILPSLERSNHQNDPSLLLWMERSREHGGQDLLLAPIKASGGEADLIYQYIKRENNKKEELESTRLLYVAATRAKKHLHLIGSVNHADGKIRKPTSGSFLAQLWPLVQQQFSVPEEHEETISDDIEMQQHLYRIVPQTNQALFAEDNQQYQGNLESIQQNLIKQETNTQQAIGIVLHAQLQQWSLQAAKHWQTNTDTWRQQLLDHDVCPSDIDSAVATLQQAVDNIQRDEKAQWILDNNHNDAHSEYAVSTVINGQVKQFIIDRTFIDNDGVRWIIDYKSSTPNDLQQAQRQHQLQLQQYADIFSKLEQRPIQLGLYFPLVPAWIEWQYNEAPVSM